MSPLQKQVQQFKTAPTLALKPNAHLADPNRAYLYQKRASLLMLLRPRMVVGDDVGLGKTYETIVAMTYIKAKNPDTMFIVFTEKACLEQWRDEILEHATGFKPKIITADTHPDPVKRVETIRLKEFDVIITTYGTAYQYTQHLLEALGERWVAICDEPNYFKSLDSMLHRNMNGMINGDIEGKPYRVVREVNPDSGKKELRYIPIPNATPAIRAYGLTATIIENRLEEAYGIMRIITPGCFPSKDYFEKNFCKMGRVPGKKTRVVTGYKNLDRFRQHIEPYFFGRLQDDPEVEQDLPEAIFKDLYIDLPPEQGRKLLEATDKLFQMPDGEIKRLDVLPSLIVAQKMANDPRLAGFDMIGAKTEALIEMLQNSMSGERVIIYSKFRSAIDLIEAECLKRNIEKPIRITGAENKTQRDESKRRFMSDGPDRANILLMTRAGAKGINLQKGAILIFYDLPWSYGTYRQIIGRLKRTGSTHSHILVIHLLARLDKQQQSILGDVATIDHHTLATVRKKFSLWKIITGDVVEIKSVTEDVMDVYNTMIRSRRAA